MSQHLGIIWETSGSLGYRSWHGEHIFCYFDQLNRIARQLKLPKLEDFLQDDVEMLEEELDALEEVLKDTEELYADPNDLDGSQHETAAAIKSGAARLEDLDGQSAWFHPDTALETVRGLMNYLHRDLADCEADAQAVAAMLGELQRLEQLLTDAEREQIRFAFCID